MGVVGMMLRSDLIKFVEAMEEILRLHDDQRGVDGWVDANYQHLLDRLTEELKEVRREVRKGNMEGVHREIIDVANFAMMVWVRTAQGKF